MTIFKGALFLRKFSSNVELIFNHHNFSKSICSKTQFHSKKIILQFQFISARGFMKLAVVSYLLINSADLKISRARTSRVFKFDFSEKQASYEQIVLHHFLVTYLCTIITFLVVQSK